jgi:hypothetical protein
MLKRILILSMLITATAVEASPPGPPPPAEYDVIIRYRIEASRTERIIQFREMTRYLESIGFKKDAPLNEDEAADASVTEMTGHIASANAHKILAERHVRAIMLFPQGKEMPKDEKQLVRVDLELTSGLKADLQYLLYAQTRGVLQDLGFQEAVGYDNHGGSRIVGNFAAKGLRTLLLDLRQTKPGSQQAMPFKSVTPIRLVDVQLGVDLVRPRPEQPAAPANLAKITPELRAILANKEEAAKPRRLEIILAQAPVPGTRTWQRPLQAASSSLEVQGQLGPLVSVVARPDEVPGLAALPAVSVVRLPRAAPLRTESAGEASGDPVHALGLDRLHQLGRRGQGVRLAIVDGEFQGYQTMIRNGRLPARTRLVDMTAERSHDLIPDPMPSSPALGHGTKCALAAALAAPEAELVLIRVDPAAPYELEEVARFINGEVPLTISLEQRGSELTAARDALSVRGTELVQERQALLNSDIPFEVFQEKWAAQQKKQQQYDADQKAHDERTNRYLNLRDALYGLKGVRVVASPLVWNEGQPVDGNGALSRYFDDRPFCAALWFQSVGDTNGQAWAGLFRDLNGDGAMEFTAPETALPAGRWTSQLNFLGWNAGATSQELPAGAKLRLSLQWREAHDPDFLAHGEDVYQEPLANLSIVILRQRDPSGQKLPADDMEVVAQSERLPQRLDNQPTAATYEHVLEFTVPAAGRYAVMISGKAPMSTRPGLQPSVAASMPVGELRPRLFIGTSEGKGRAVLVDFTNDGTDRGEEGSLGMPGDAHAVVTVGSAANGGRAAFAPPGPPFNLRLLAKPDVLAYDQLDVPGGGRERGSRLAASYAAGLAASGMSAGIPQRGFLRALGTQPGGVLRITPDRLPR